MVKILPESRGKLLGIEVTRKFTQQDYHKVVGPCLQAILNEQGAARVLVFCAADFQGWELDALQGEEAGFRRDLEKLAVVGGSWWVRLQLQILTALMSGEVETFDDDELEEAWEWLEA